MARDSSGFYTLPGTAFVQGQTAQAPDMNAKLADLAAEMTDSVSRSAKGGFTSPIRTVDGAVASPGFAFTQETGSGWYRVSAGVLGLAVLGVQVAKATASGLSALAYGPLTATSAILRGAVADGVSAVGTILDNSVSLANAAAKLLSVRNGGVEKFYLDTDGGVHVGGGGGQVYATGFRSLQNAQASIIGSPVDGVSAVGVANDTSTTLSNAGAKLLSVRNGGAEKAYFDRDGNLSTPSLVGSGNVSRTNLVAVGEQISSSCGAFVTSSLSPVDVTNLAVTITTTGRPVYLFLVPDSTANASGLQVIDVDSSVGIQILRGATLIGYWTIGGSAAAGFAVPSSAIQFLDPVAPGTYTYKVQAWRAAGTGNVGVNRSKLAAFEL
jgi:hypothetical protein